MLARTARKKRLFESRKEQPRNIRWNKKRKAIHKVRYTCEIRKGGKGSGVRRRQRTGGKK